MEEPKKEEIVEPVPPHKEIIEIEPPVLPILKDFVTTRYTNEKNEESLRRIRMSGKTASGLTTYAVWRSAIA